jgi:hypothetical protein
MYIHQSHMDLLDCQQAVQLSWNASILEECPLFSRKFGPRTAAPATKLLTSCEPYLGIASDRDCDYWN